jgi:probable RNA-binding protein EIF1AD
MGKPKRNIISAAEETSNPPDELTPTQLIARVIKGEGNSLYSCVLPDQTILVELEPRFRNTIWIKRGGYVLIDTKEAAVRQNKIAGEIINVVRDERSWRKQSYWWVLLTMFLIHLLTSFRPREFPKTPEYAPDDDEEESNVGKMPPSDSDEDD